jgi:hypothetical protein
MTASVAPDELRRRGKQAKRLRYIIWELGIVPHTIAATLKVSAREVEAWAQGHRTIPPSTFEVIDLTFRRMVDDDFDGRVGFPQLLVRYAKSAGLPGFLT